MAESNEWSMPCVKCGITVKFIDGVEQDHPCGAEYVLRDIPTERGTRWKDGKPYHYALRVSTGNLALLPGRDPREVLKHGVDPNG